MLSCLLYFTILISLVNSSDNGGLKVNIHKFREQIFLEHNKYRSYHGLGPLKNDDSLTKKAQKYADASAKDGFFNTTGIEGKNLYMAVTKDPSYILPADRVVGEWYAEIKNYNFHSSENEIWYNRTNVAKFTQIIWNSTHDIGIGYAESQKEEEYKFFVVCQYYPSGNRQHKYIPSLLPQYKLEVDRLIVKYGNSVDSIKLQIALLFNCIALVQFISRYFCYA